jgi:hypothetical protein
LLSIWADLTEKINACKDKCSFELAAEFKTTAEGFKHM